MLTRIRTVGLNRNGFLTVNPVVHRNHEANLNIMLYFIDFFIKSLLRVYLRETETSSIPNVDISLLPS
jgi:hypothetical protein